MSFIVFLSLLLHLDGGTPTPVKPAAHKDDAEVVKNLELLELLDETSDYELLEELSVER